MSTIRSVPQAGTQSLETLEEENLRVSNERSSLPMTSALDPVWVCYMSFHSTQIGSCVVSYAKSVTFLAASVVSQI